MNLAILRPLQLTIVLLLISLFGYSVSAQTRTVLSLSNEFGGETVEYANPDESRLIQYFGDDDNLVKEETLYTVDYDIDNNLERVVVHYFFGKKTTEELFYNRTYSNRTLIEKSINHYDRETEEHIKQENHFIAPFTGYNVIYRHQGKKTKIEWYYPDNEDGIKLNVAYFDSKGNNIKTESYYTDKTVEENGYFKRIYFMGYNNQYLRKVRQEWYYTDAFADKNRGISKKVEIFHHQQGQAVRSEVLLFDRDERYIKR